MPAGLGPKDYLRDAYYLDGMPLKNAKMPTKRRTLLIFSMLLCGCSCKTASYQDGTALLSTDSPNITEMMQNFDIPINPVIGHRGASYHAPEGTAISHLIGRQLGADYLEADLQRTKDGVLIVLHDEDLQRTTNIRDVYPERATAPVSQFTLSELKRLDAGSWFNAAFPERARPSYVGVKIITLDELMNIAEGKLADGSPDPADSRNRPGIYLETKKPELFPGIELDLCHALQRRGYLNPQKSPLSGKTLRDKNGKVQVGGGRSRIFLETFQPSSVVMLHRYMPQLPLTFLVRLFPEDPQYPQDHPNADFSKTNGPLMVPTLQLTGESSSQFRARLQIKSVENFQKWMSWAKAHGATCVGPSAQLAEWSDPVAGFWSATDLIKPWMDSFTQSVGLCLHVYTIDSVVDYQMVQARGVDGVFTNRPDVGLKFFNKQMSTTVPDILRSYNM